MKLGKNTKTPERHFKFVQEFLVDNNGTKAAIRAGYSEKAAAQIATRLLRYAHIEQMIAEGRKLLAEKTETEAEWVRRRLREEAMDKSEFSTHSARVRALELLGKVNGIFEADNKQKTDPVRELLNALPGAVVGVKKVLDYEEPGDE